MGYVDLEIIHDGTKSENRVIRYSVENIAFSACVDFVLTVNFITLILFDFCIISPIVFGRAVEIILNGLERDGDE